MRLYLLHVAPISPLLTSSGLIILHEQWKSRSLSLCVFCIPFLLLLPYIHLIATLFWNKSTQKYQTLWQLALCLSRQFRSHCTAVICSGLSTSYATQTHARTLHLDLTCDSTASDHTTFFTSPLETNFIVHVVLRTLSSSSTKYHWTKILTKTLTYYIEEAWVGGSSENVWK